MARSASFAQISMSLSESLLHVPLDRAIAHGIGSGVLVRYLSGLSHRNQRRSIVFIADAPDFLRISDADPEALDAIVRLHADDSSRSVETLFTEILRMSRTHGQISTSSGERWELPEAVGLHFDHLLASLPRPR